MYCGKDCSCSLCRELRNYKPTKPTKRPAPRPPTSLFGRFNENFILRRRSTANSFKTFQPQSLKCSEMFQQRAAETTPNLYSEQPSPQLAAQQQPQEDIAVSATATRANKPAAPPKPNHKVVIYFGDSIANRGKHNVGETAKDVVQAAQLLDDTALDELAPKQRSADGLGPKSRGDGDDDLPSYIESVQNGVINIKIEGNYQRASALVETVAKPTFATVHVCTEAEQLGGGGVEDNASQQSCDSCDWSFVQEWRARPTGNMRGDMPVVFSPQPTNSQLHCPVGSPTTTGLPHQNQMSVMPTSPSTGTTMTANSAPLNTPNGLSSSTGRIQSPAVATPAPRISKEVAQRLNSGVSGAPHMMASPQTGHSVVPNTTINIRNISSPPQAPSKPPPHRALAAPARLTVQSTPVKSQPPMLSGNLSPQQPQPQQPTAQQKFNANDKRPLPLSLDLSNCSIGIPTSESTSANVTPSGGGYQLNTHAKSSATSTRTHHHEFRALQRVQECHSSSDENRSSGHASMSDTGGHGSSSPGGGVALGPLPEDRLAAAVTNRSTRSRTSTNHSRARHRATPATKAPWSGSGLEDIKLAIQQLTMRSQTSTSTYSSLSAGSESSEPARRLGRYSSLETVNTNVTNADEFVWVDSHNRLVELQHPPWSQHCIMRVIRNGRCKEQAERVSVDTIPRLGYLLQRALVRIAREVQRLSACLGLCSKQEVAAAYKIVLCPALADSCIKACLRAAAMFAVTGDSALKQSKSARAGLQLPVGRFHRWMADARLGKFIHEYAAVYLCAGMENLLEELLLQSFPADTSSQFTTAVLDQSIAHSGDLWGLLQPFAHLNAGRIASGALTMPRWASLSSLGSGTQKSGSSGGNSNVSLEPCLLTTCVGSITELKDLTLRAQQKFQHTALSNAALSTLFYFMRCSQLEHSDLSGAPSSSSGSAGGSSQNVQELCYERAYVVLPPLVEWLRVASAHAEYRHAVMIDKDDIMQAARLLLPGVDCPMRPIGHEEELPTKKTHFSHPGATTPIASSISEDTTELGKRATIMLAFKLMLTGRAELMAQAANLLPPTTRYDTLNHAGLTALMIAAIRNDEVAIQALLDAGCDPNVEVPPVGQQNFPGVHPDTQHWTAVTFAASRANYLALRLLLERGGKVEGGARLSEEKPTLTPLQVACGSGNVEVISLLLAHGANGFLSTQQKDTMCFAGGSAQRGSYCAISVTAAHGQRACLRKLLSHPMSPGSKDVLSLEEMLAEGEPVGNASRGSACAGNAGSERISAELPLTLNKTQIKSLQEAMYHSAENNHLDITIELRTLGVPWTLHCWMHALAAAHELRLDAVIDQLLQDFLQVCPDDYSAQFVSECLPLLFNIFRYSKNEGTTLLLADIFATCFGWEAIKTIKEAVMQSVNSSRIDPKFVNNPELSDVTFRVEGKIFYGHKIVLVTASPRFQSMLSSKLSDGNTPTVQINDIRYHIFQLVMHYLYSGGCATLEVSNADVLELMAAASFFQLEGLLRYTESRCSEMIDIDNVVAMYIHAKVYNANKLLEYCQGFLLQNMVALLTYDDSVKRLLFAKKIPNHDVLSGLLHTLQQRIKQRKPMGVGNFRQQLSSPPPGTAGAHLLSTSLSNGVGGSLGAAKK
ncbi:ankyrin repeat and BTB/POZ domain-containing protein 2 isoform X1 [Zeugodacus cucurbitae]|uniref:Ankyrin repeat and BTB/POZ domain-containing protein 2 n=1 Tax=Zeugodacus cucurbitae TaxID=28588 RepID=A0A0A1XNZ7_ZEUCU|nr:ankyrin repeat and BTB/POZ domain-containing protein 2 isoform X1 [Zeugodacus cucurbitae]XP_054084440.1 ankyrin repeat and BTB/POZ domain-containing protein 2 isoform X1 [Zeugodacus cucurbitae]